MANDKSLAVLIFTLSLQLGIQNSNAQQQDIVEAAEAGDAHAQFLLGDMYNSGRGHRKDVKQAIKWFREAANQGHIDALFQLGVMFETGRGTTKDIKEAVKWYRAAAEAGNADAMYTLSLMYSSGTGLTKNEEQADYWYNKALDHWGSGGGSRIDRTFLRHDR